MDIEEGAWNRLSGIGIQRKRWNFNERMNWKKKKTSLNLVIKSVDNYYGMACHCVASMSSFNIAWFHNDLVGYWITDSIHSRTKLDGASCNKCGTDGVVAPPSKTMPGPDTIHTWWTVRHDEHGFLFASSRQAYWIAPVCSGRLWRLSRKFHHSEVKLLLYVFWWVPERSSPSPSPLPYKSILKPKIVSALIYVHVYIYLLYICNTLPTQSVSNVS